MECIVLSIELNYLICTIKLWTSSVYMGKHQQIRKCCTEKHFVVQHFILIVCKDMYNYLHMQYLKKNNIFTLKWIFMLPIFILIEFHSENCVRCSFINFNNDLLSNELDIKAYFITVYLDKIYPLYSTCIHLEI